MEIKFEEYHININTTNNHGNNQPYDGKKRLSLGYWPLHDEMLISDLLAHIAMYDLGW